MINEQFKIIDENNVIDFRHLILLKMVKLHSVHSYSFNVSIYYIHITYGK